MGLRYWMYLLVVSLLWASGVPAMGQSPAGEDLLERYAALSSQEDYLLYLEALDSQEAPAAGLHRAEWLTCRGMCLRFLQREEEGARDLEEAIAIFRQYPDEASAVAAMAFNSLGHHHYHARQDLEAALAAYQEASAELARLPVPDSLEWSGVLHSLGKVASRMGEYADALAYYEHALDIRVRLYGEPSSRVAFSHSQIGNLFQMMERYDEARAAYLRALRNYADSGDPRRKSEAATRNNLANCYQELGRPDSARQYFTEALRMLEEGYGPEHPTVIYALINVAGLDWQVGRRDLGIAKVREAIRRTRAGGEQGLEGEALLRLAEMLQETQPDQALDQVEQAMGLMAGGEATTTEPYPVNLFLYPQQIEALRLRAALLMTGLPQSADSLDRMVRALDSYVAAADIVEQVWARLENPESKLFLSQNGNNLYGEGIKLAHRLWSATHEEAYLAAAFALMERSKAQMQQEAAAEARAVYLLGIPDAILNQRDSLLAALTEVNHALKLADEQQVNAVSELRADKIRLLAAVDSMDKAMARDFPAFGRLMDEAGPVGLPELRTYLEGHQACLLSYFWAEEELYVLALTGTEHMFRRLDLPENAKAVVQEVLEIAAHPSPSRQDEDLFGRQAYLLYTWLLAPEAGLMASADRLVVVPDGLLGTLPFELLLTRHRPEVGWKDMAFLFLDQPISYSPSASLLLSSPPGAAPGSGVLGFAWSDEAEDARTTRGNWGDLPGTRAEVMAIAGQFAGRYLYGKEASEAAFKRFGADYQVIHLAMHGKAGPNEPQLVFPAAGEGEDGILFLHELYHLRLGAQLAFLSACESGRGKVWQGEGVMSMARGFGIAGCPRVVMSLWEVQDAAGQQMVRTFYRQLSLGRPTDEALWQARKRLFQMVDGRQAAPFYWAAFISLGPGDPLSLASVVSASPPIWPWYLVGLSLLAMLAALVLRWRHNTRKNP